MDLIHPQLAAFATVLEEGSFEAAGRRLSLTASALSQRVKALEDRLGQVLLVRQTPCLPTPAGEKLLLRLQPMKVLQAEALADLNAERTSSLLPLAVTVAVDRDSLQSWVMNALATLHQQHGYIFDIRVGDADGTLAMLREGTVLGAVTSQARPLKGCNVLSLGTLRYRPIASPTFAQRYFPEGIDARGLARAPMLIFNRRDELPWMFLRQITRARISPPAHHLPACTDILDAVRSGLGWSIAPVAQVDAALADRSLVALDPVRTLAVPLYWQHSAVRSSTLQIISRTFAEAAHRANGAGSPEPA
ncbi:MULTISPECIES: LysR family transcriptional regulator ArgP [Stenotrophomonas]|uniref:LysR family transcriptional regulator ArgP n=1 Tax=Stenotrophomonas maltophilia TaxID=40324 RepID=A0A431UP26_STEMA|nr:LysR family transcriptional regulator ArgP [Stenotrophomonas maltophilia]RTQ91508.1 LysR family transcriptional regulator ArgP [Stenotrophomonas maltophilia]